jgi:hypothetical protein
MFGGAFTSSQQTLLSSADPNQRATVVAWNNAMMFAGVAVGTTALGFVAAGSVSFAVITGALGLAAVATTALLLVTSSRTDAAAPTIEGTQCGHSGSSQRIPWARPAYWVKYRAGHRMVSDAPGLGAGEVAVRGQTS